MESYVREMVGRLKWKRNIKVNLVSNFVSISDEALTLLAIDNSGIVWEACALGYPSPSTKYTNKASMRIVTEGRSEQGHIKYNEFYDYIKKNRMTTEYKECERKYMEIICQSIDSVPQGHDDMISLYRKPIVTKDDLGLKNYTTTLDGTGLPEVVPV